jgi:hypothetical protein
VVRSRSSSVATVSRDERGVTRSNPRLTPLAAEVRGRAQGARGGREHHIGFVHPVRLTGPPQSLGCEPRQDHGPPTGVGLGVILPDEAPALDVDQGAADGRCRRRRLQVDVRPPQRQHLADAGAGRRQHVNDVQRVGGARPSDMTATRPGRHPVSVEMNATRSPSNRSPTYLAAR